MTDSEARICVATGCDRTIQQVPGVEFNIDKLFRKPLNSESTKLWACSLEHSREAVNTILKDMPYFNVKDDDDDSESDYTSDEELQELLPPRVRRRLNSEQGRSESSASEDESSDGERAPTHPPAVVIRPSPPNPRPFPVTLRSLNPTTAATTTATVSQTRDNAAASPGQDPVAQLRAFHDNNRVVPFQRAALTLPQISHHALQRLWWGREANVSALSA